MRSTVCIAEVELVSILLIAEIVGGLLSQKASDVLFVYPK